MPFENTRDVLGDQQTLDGIISDTLTELKDDNVSSLQPRALAYKDHLRTVELPNLTSADFNAFVSSKGLRTVIIPNLEEPDFSGCTGLKTLDMKGKSYQHNYASRLANTRGLVHLILRNPNGSYPSSKAQLPPTFYTGTARGACHVYVPDNIVSDYGVSANWTANGSNIYPISSYPVEHTYGGTITDSWETIIQNCEDGNIDGYNIGDTKEVICNGFYINMVIVAKNSDIIHDGDGAKASLTWISEKTVPFVQKMRASNNNTGGWRDSLMREAINDENQFIIYPEVVRTGIKAVDKTCFIKGSTVTVNDKIWIPSIREVFGEGSDRENSGVTYTNYFDSADARKVFDATTGQYITWHLRSTSGTDNFATVNSSGILANIYATYDAHSKVFGFCT